MNASPVLFLTYWYPSKSNKGFGIFIKRHAHAVKRNKPVIMLAFITRNSNLFFKKSVRRYTDEAGTETHEIVIETYFNKLFYVLLPFQFVIINSYLRQSNIRFGAIISNVVFPCGIIGYYLAKRHCSKHYIIEHWTKVDKFFNRSLYASRGRLAYGTANRVIAVSDQLKETLKKHNVRANIVVIPNVIDPAEFFYDRALSPNPVFTFLGVASWSQFKNPFMFLDPLNTLAAKKLIGEFKVVLVGTGDYLQEVKSRNYLFEIEFRGTLSSSEIRSEMNRSHVFVHGSEFETFSVVIAEALCCGLPCVVSPVGIAPEVIKECNGFIAKDKNDWMRMLQAVYNRNYDRELISNDMREKFSYEKVSRLFDEALV